MADVDYTANNKYADRGAITITWSNLARGDDGTAFQPKQFAMTDRSIQVFGDFDGAPVYILGSNEIENPTHFTDIRDPAGNLLTFTSAGLKQILESCAWIKPSVGGAGGGTDVTVVLYLKAR